MVHLTTPIDAGKEGEQAARNYLEAQGYEILEMNWRHRRLEVDIIARHNYEIVFVEVKSRHPGGVMDAEQAVNRRKQGHLVSAAHSFMTERELDMEARFDIITVTFARSGARVKHLPGAFRAVAK